MMAQPPVRRSPGCTGKRRELRLNGQDAPAGWAKEVRPYGINRFALRVGDLDGNMAQVRA